MSKEITRTDRELNDGIQKELADQGVRESVCLRLLMITNNPCCDRHDNKIKKKLHHTRLFLIIEEGSFLDRKIVGFVAEKIGKSNRKI